MRDGDGLVYSPYIYTRAEFRAIMFFPVNIIALSHTYYNLVLGNIIIHFLLFLYCNVRKESIMMRVTDNFYMLFVTLTSLTIHCI